MKVLVLGGYGNFGGRIVRALAGTPGMVLLVGGRDIHRATRCAVAVGAQPVRVDATHPDVTARRRFVCDFPERIRAFLRGPAWRLSAGQASCRSCRRRWWTGSCSA